MERHECPECGGPFCEWDGYFQSFRCRSDECTYTYRPDPHLRSIEKWVDSTLDSVREAAIHHRPERLQDLNRLKDKMRALLSQLELVGESSQENP